ncbi:FHA domain-containing protein [Pseudonocardia sp. GCM10023141]|uniref:FHA domain-containing protein n=1 Tax=Pseudonocardia sp. GCM10023141 TaxID=3252653 RepID=UPI0036159ED0
MAACPAGHESATTDYCDVCGTAMAPAAASPAAPPAATPAGPVDPPPGGTTCPQCGAAKDGRFCEVCGHDGATPADIPAAAQPAAPAPPEEPTWTVVVEADRAWFDEVRSRNGPDAGLVEFPQYCPQRRFTLAGPQLAIGRRSRSRGIDPEIDLTGPPLDPGVSTLHALLLARPDGDWEIVDVGSTNGTTIGDAPSPIAANTPVRLADGDRIRIGAWTTITVAHTGERWNKRRVPRQSP